jgi:predicted RNase H-like HicB family nuclease
VSEQLHLTIRYSDAGDGWVTAQIAEIPGAISQGESREQARANVLDALELLLARDEKTAGGDEAADSESLTLTSGETRRPRAASARKTAVVSWEGSNHARWRGSTIGPARSVVTARSSRARCAQSASSSRFRSRARSRRSSVRQSG